eukprot:TRINITY_DN4433_c0_g1_i11.p1 TRINITY_DN4433_c0_g1~~TRINITY_DN4433_c0_g1_i11.p1  ORF type:complete len:256 (+),score=45.21 TRINITY_DN4433_c0_g1_i11:66-833(+)
MCIRDSLYPQGKWKTMNYGYALLNENGRTINLKNEDEDERFSLQLYNLVATGMGKINSLKDKTVLEIGSGRGGGLYFVKTYLNAKSCYGVDVSASQVEFCNTNYAQIENLHYVNGNAESFSTIPELKDQQFDIVINVESSHCYGNFPRFVNEVEKVLKTGGYFITTDFRANDKIAEWKIDLESGSLKIVHEEDITVNVQHALKLDENRRKTLISQYVNPLLRGFFEKFSGLTDSRIYKEFQEQKTIYMCYLLQKQ